MQWWAGEQSNLVDHADPDHFNYVYLLLSDLKLPFLHGTSLSNNVPLIIEISSITSTFTPIHLFKASPFFTMLTRVGISIARAYSWKLLQPLSSFHASFSARPQFCEDHLRLAGAPRKGLENIEII